MTWLVLAALFGTTSVALAEPLVSLDPAPDGTLILVGSGWRPGSRMVVSVGRDQFSAQADSVGDFEIQTGLVATASPPELLAVHRPDGQITFAPVAPRPVAENPQSLAILFAQSLMTGTVFLAVSASSLGLVALATRVVHFRRDARRQSPNPRQSLRMP